LAYIKKYPHTQIFVHLGLFVAVICIAMLFFPLPGLSSCQFGSGFVAFALKFWQIPPPGGAGVRPNSLLMIASDPESDQ
jgi:hypothetical protein